MIVERLRNAYAVARCYVVDGARAPLLNNTTVEYITRTKKNKEKQKNDFQNIYQTD